MSVRSPWARAIALSVFLVAVSMAAFPARRASAGDTKVAVVDVQGAVMETEDGQRAKATLKKLFDKKQADLDARKTEFDKIGIDIDKQRHVLSREALERRVADWQQRRDKLQGDLVGYTNDLQKRQSELVAPILRKVLEVVARVAKQNGYEVVIDKQAVPYVRADIDITAQVLQLYRTGGDTGAEEKKPDNK